jgi:hypothetical protein
MIDCATRVRRVCSLRHRDCVECVVLARHCEIFVEQQKQSYVVTTHLGSMLRATALFACMACCLAPSSAYKVILKNMEHGASFYVFPLSGTSAKHGLRLYNDEAACAWDNASCYSHELIETITNTTRGERIE